MNLAKKDQDSSIPEDTSLTDTSSSTHSMSIFPIKLFKKYFKSIPKAGKNSKEEWYRQCEHLNVQPTKPPFRIVGPDANRTFPIPGTKNSVTITASMSVEQILRKCQLVTTYHIDKLLKEHADKYHAIEGQIDGRILFSMICRTLCICGSFNIDLPDLPLKAVFCRHCGQWIHSKCLANSITQKCITCQSGDLSTLSTQLSSTKRSEVFLIQLFANFVTLISIIYIENH